MVGTVRVTPPPAGASSSAAAQSLRSSIDSMQLTAAGFCRLDPRWHGKDELNEKFGDANDLRPINALLPDDLPLPSNTAPFWSAGTIELMELEERTVGNWDEVRPKPILLPERYTPGRKKKLEALAALRDRQDRAALEMRQLAFSFRVDLPPREAAPHTLVATSCRYYYTISVRMSLASSNPDAAPVWTEMPVAVYTADRSSSSSSSSSLERDYGDAPALQAVAHSSGLPTHLTAEELHRLEGQWTVNRRGAALFRSVVAVGGGGGAQSMKVADPSSGRPACFLTIMGASPLHPGSRMLLKLDFPTAATNDGEEEEEDSASQWLPCFQASACLQAQEVAISSKGVRKRARRHLFCTAHQDIDPKTTESVSLNLMLPAEAPCSVATDTIEIAVECLIDIAVGARTKSSFCYRNLRLEIPCQVTHAVADWERRDEDEEEEWPGKRMYEQIVASGKERSDDPTEPSSFRYKGIVQELKILSLHMADACGLRPRPAPLQRDQRR